MANYLSKFHVLNLQFYARNLEERWARPLVSFFEVTEAAKPQTQDE
jgi:hypothetical protein